jgi:hypothetical protein
VPAVPEPIGITVHLEDVDVMGEAVEERIRELERMLGRKTEVEILKEALAAARAKKPLLRWPSPDPDGSR